MPAVEPSTNPRHSTVFARSAVTSAVATGSDFLVASGLVACAVPAGTATFVGCIGGGLVAFSVNRGWAFRATARPGPQLVRFVGVWAASAALNAGGVASLFVLFGVRFVWAWLLVRALVFSAWNYPLLRWFVFPRGQTE